MSRFFIALGTFNAFLCVALGAMGAHVLKAQLTADMLANYQTGVQYHFYHALGLVLVGLLFDRFSSSRLLTASGMLMCAGILFFSGTLYIISLTGIRGLGMIAPLGGISYMSAWLLLTYAAWKH